MFEVDLYLADDKAIGAINKNRKLLFSRVHGQTVSLVQLNLFLVILLNLFDGEVGGLQSLRLLLSG